MSKAPPFSLQEKTLIVQTVTWVKTVNDAKPAGAPPSYPKPVDIDSSALFKRIRQGLQPMPWAPPTRHGQPAYELIENARGQHRVVPEGDMTAGDSIWLDGAKWHRWASEPDQRVHYISFGRWPLAYRLHAYDAPRWQSLPADIDAGSGHDVVRFPDGRLVSKDLVRRTRDEVIALWCLQCVSPLNERLYLGSERQPLDDPDHFRPSIVHRRAAGVAQVFVCPLRQGPTLFFPLTTDPWTRITRYVALRSETNHDPSAWLSHFDAGESPLDFLPRMGAWQVFEIDAQGEPLSAWRTDRSELLLPVAAEAPRPSG